MIPTIPEPRSGHKAVVFAKSQPQYLPLPANTDGEYVETKWKLSLRERLAVLWYGSMYLTLRTFGSALQPIKCSILRQE